MSDIPLFTSINGKVCNLAGNQLSRNINLCSIADYLKSLDVQMANGTYIRFSEQNGTSYGCYHFVHGVLYSTPQGNPFNGGYCQGVSQDNPATITFDNVPNKNGFSPPFLLTATSDQPMPIYFTSDDPGIIYIIGNSGYVTGEGCVNLSATQDVSGSYGGGIVTQDVCVDVLQQIITESGSLCVPNTTQSGYYDIDMTPRFTSNRPGASIQFYSYEPYYADILGDGHTLRIYIDTMLGDGTCNAYLQVYELGGGGYSSAEISPVVTINADFCDGSC